MSETRKNIIGALAAEIERIARKHERLTAMIPYLPPNERAVIKFSANVMKAEIDAAKAALGGGDSAAIIATLQSLKEYDDD